ncbi:MAG: peptidyl-tRNA hydrolase Pth2 [Nitrososphaerales archaeon]
MSSEGYKQVLVIRTDLKMGKGKVAVQVAHAAVSAANVAKRSRPLWYKSWISGGQAKVAVRISELEELIELRDGAAGNDIPYYLIEDRGLTQVEPGTITCLGLGPAPSHLIDKLTRNLKLL